MDDGSLFAVAALIYATIIFSVSLSIAWFVIYTTAGSWLKVRLIHIRLDPSFGIPKRYGSMIVSHILCSVLFVNPFIILCILSPFLSKPDIQFLLLIIAIAYFWLVPLGTDCLIERVLPRWSRLRWFEYRPPLKRLVLANLANLAVGSLAFAVGVVCTRIF